MSLRGKLDRLEKTMWGQLAHFELAGGRRYYFDPQEAHKVTFLYLSDSLDADYKREPRPEPPDLLKAVADAKDRGEALNLVVGGYSHLPIERGALVERGKLKPRSLVAGREYEDLGVLEDPSE